MSVVNLSASTQNDEFVLPSEEIQQLFKFKNQHSPEIVLSASAKSSLSFGDDFSFTQEEFAKMPSTLMKAVKRTEMLMEQTDAARKTAIETNNELKGIHSLLVRYAKKTLKDLDKPESIAVEEQQETGKVKGFRRQCKISDEMCSFIGLTPGSMSSRVEVNSAITKYVKTNGLVKKENAQHILPDEKLWSLLSEDAKGNKITYFSIQKYIKHHYKE
jgi:chromatin remodeling complex protein RSC6